MLNRLFILLFSIVNTSCAFGAFKIDCLAFNVVEGSLVRLIKYNIGEIEVARTNVNLQKFSFCIESFTEDGVYTIVLSNKSSDSHTYIHKFDVIIDSSENYINCKIDLANHELFTIIASKINANYYEFLKIRNFRIAVINYLTEKINSDQEIVLNGSNNLRHIRESEIKELSGIKTNYIQCNFNKWSTYLIENDVETILFNNVSRENYWSFFSTDNRDLIYTPIFQKIIQFYVVNYYTNPKEDDYIFAFDEVIRQFKDNEETNKWVVKYVAMGLHELGNKRLIDYFQKKYN